MYRSIYTTVLFALTCTAWLILAGTQSIDSVGDMARFGAVLFQLLAPLQLALVVFFAALSAASGVAQEKDRQTLILLLLTRLNNSELVLGKYFASLLHVMTMVLAGLPVFAIVTLFGGVSAGQVLRVFLVTAVSSLLAGSLGSTIGLWREKTFQTLALTCLLIVFWALLGESVLRFGDAFAAQLGWQAIDLAVALSPARAILAAARPEADLAPRMIDQPVFVFLLMAGTATIALHAIAIWKVRRWNPSREVRRPGSEAPESIWGGQEPLDGATSALRAEQARGSHVDERLRQQQRKRHRHVWRNPILWREICTWAYGRKILLIRVAYLALFAATVLGVLSAEESAASVGAILAPVARPVIPFFVVSLAIINALAVTSVTTERDGRSLDLLLVTDLSPGEFLMGKLGGVFWVAKEMVLLPIAVCLMLWWHGWLSTENLAYVAGGLLVMDLFVAMLGVHCGSIYANSRTAIAVSLGTVFFLFLGVTTCILMMISFSGSFHVQLAPFLAFILGGSVGLYVALGARNPSPAMLAASLLLPFATFYAITSFLLDWTLAVFVVTAVAYGFATLAMMIPALSQFNFSMGRSSAPEEQT